MTWPSSPLHRVEYPPYAATNQTAATQPWTEAVASSTSAPRESSSVYGAAPRMTGASSSTPRRAAATTHRTSALRVATGGGDGELYLSQLLVMSNWHELSLSMYVLLSTIFKCIFINPLSYCIPGNGSRIGTNRVLNMCFIDHTKEFDKVKREKIM